MEQGWLGSNGAALGFHPGIAAALPSQKAEGARGDQGRKGMTSRSPLSASREKMTTLALASLGCVGERAGMLFYWVGLGANVRD